MCILVSAILVVLLTNIFLQVFELKLQKLKGHALTVAVGGVFYLATRPRLRRLTTIRAIKLPLLLVFKTHPIGLPLHGFGPLVAPTPLFRPTFPLL